jgi:hypothetical protein
MDPTPEMRDVTVQALWIQGELGYKHHSAQEYLDTVYQKSPKQLFVGNCSRQWGKSYWAVTKAIQTAIKTPRAQIRYGAAFQTDLVDFIIPAFDKVLEDAPAAQKGRRVGNFYIFPNGSRIKLVGLDKNPNGLRGNTLDLIIIDECGFVSNLDYIYKSIIIPATLHRPNCKIIFISTPPSTPAHPFVDYIQKAEAEGAYVKLDIYTNPMITPDDIKRMIDEMGGIESTTFRRECLCELVTDSDLAIIPEWNDKWIQDLERDEFYKYYHKYVGMDLGVKDLTAAIFGYFDFKRASLIIEDEFDMHGPSMNTKLLVGEIRAKEKELWNNVEKVEPDGRIVYARDPNDSPIPFRRISDNNWPILIQDLSSLHNLTFIETNKDNLEAMINEVRLMVQAGQIIINPRCKKMIGCLKHGVWDNKKKQFARSTVYGHFDHLAALIYLVRNLAKSTNTIPATHGHENHRSWMMHVQNQKSHNAKELARAILPKSNPVVLPNRNKRGIR